MSTYRFFLTPVRHLDGEGYSYAAFCVSSDNLEHLQAARSSLQALCPEGKHLHGSVTLRGNANGVLFDSFPDSLENLRDCADEAGNSETPVEISEEQYGQIAESDGSESTDCAGFRVDDSTIRFVCYPRHGDGQAESTANFSDVVFGEPVAA